jgi:Flp pilus assembly protein TadG
MLAGRACSRLVRQTAEYERGAAAVGFALVSILPLTLLFGIIQYAYFFQSQGACATTRAAARLAAVGCRAVELYLGEGPK